jgi:hypothetical protein
LPGILRKDKHGMEPGTGSTGDRWEPSKALARYPRIHAMMHIYNDEQRAIDNSDS